MWFVFRPPTGNKILGYVTEEEEEEDFIDEHKDKWRKITHGNNTYSLCKGRLSERHKPSYAGHAPMLE